MRKPPMLICLAAACVAILGGLAWFDAPGASAPAAEQPANPDDSPVKPVEGDTHEFMGYLFEPTFERLKQSFASRPSSDGDWKRVASDALILGEGGNLLLLRNPNQKGGPWESNANGLRTFAGLVYRYARTKDAGMATFYYQHMVEQCNDCHREYAAGEPQLKP